MHDTKSEGRLGKIRVMVARSSIANQCRAASLRCDGRMHIRTSHVRFWDNNQSNIALLDDRIDFILPFFM